MADVNVAAIELCKEDELNEKENFGSLLPCRKLSPLEPFIKLEEYFMLERDRGKYLLYMAAIDSAVHQILASRPNTRSSVVKCLVLGPGLGRLIAFCLDACKQQGANAVVHVLEANPLAVEFLRKQFGDLLGKTVYIYDPFIFHPDLSVKDLPEPFHALYRSFDIITSELLGCFGDDEFLPELTASLYNLFLHPTKGIPIPQSWSTYVVPITSALTIDHLKNHKKSLSAGYTMGVPEDCLFVSNAKLAWDGDCRKAEDVYQTELEFKCAVSTDYNNNDEENDDDGNDSDDDERNDVDNEECFVAEICKDKSMQDVSGCIVNNSPNVKGNKQLLHLPPTKTAPTELAKEHVKENLNNSSTLMRKQSSKIYIHGMLGFFTAVLFPDIIIDTRSTNIHQRNCFHWESFFFPFLNPISLDSKGTKKLLFSLKRKLERVRDREDKLIKLKLWYEWQAYSEDFQEKSSKNKCARKDAYNLGTRCIYNKDGETDAVYLNCK
ncbi:protein arginine N-methyltransferase HSL7 [Nematostella vectensis]|uniref:protein arginine N-methyltransferase HSL7 n=1 Tax=Nematostella vectensis TaxID=45351 RepID=UPI0020779229|nr:protein arginine N-methyltransferase HSL7 [Nematostella vectensis]XP_032227837.2 protein arginine N-methyltransferase HSL7 [Nematostella vectensis]